MDSSGLITINQILKNIKINSTSIVFFVSYYSKHTWDKWTKAKDRYGTLKMDSKHSLKLFEYVLLRSGRHKSPLSGSVKKRETGLSTHLSLVQTSQSTVKQRVEITSKLNVIHIVGRMVRLLIYSFQPGIYHVSRTTC